MLIAFIDELVLIFIWLPVELYSLITIMLILPLSVALKFTAIVFCDRFELFAALGLTNCIELGIVVSFTVTEIFEEYSPVIFTVLTVIT